MKIRSLLLCLIILPHVANADIYKWKDKGGEVRYSDVSPLSNIKKESLYGKKIPKPQAVLVPIKADELVAVNKDPAAKNKTPVTKEEAALKRANDAEDERKLNETKANEQGIRESNCRAAMANLKTHNDGGRIVRINDKGVREYLSNTEIAQGKIDAQNEIDKNCEK